MSPSSRVEFEYRGCVFTAHRAGAGEPVLLIQGTGVHGDGWLPQVEGLAEGFECVWFDNRGVFGSQPRGAAKITVEQMADDAGALIEQLGWEGAHVVGHSLGGCIALELALNRPRLVRSLSLLCTSASGADLTRMSGEMMWRSVRMMVGSRGARRRAFLELVLSPGERQRDDLDQFAVELEAVFGHDLAVQPPGAMRQVAAMRSWSATGRLDKVSAPTLLVSAEHDPIARPEVMREMASRIDGAKYVEIEGAAHGVTITRAGRINDLLRSHFSTIP